jgi:hypothetical protein
VVKINLAAAGQSDDVHQGAWWSATFGNNSHLITKHKLEAVGDFGGFPLPLAKTFAATLSSANDW